MAGRLAWVLVLGSLCIAALTAVPAGAATTVGSSLRQRANLYVRCAAACTDLQAARPGGASLALPSGGILTVWRVRAASPGTVRLRVLRPQQDGALRVAGSSDAQRLDRPHAPGKDVLYTFTAGIVVQPGDRLALDRDRKAGAVFHSYANDTSWGTASLDPPPADGATFTPPAPPDAGRELLLNADVEADTDGDGFGDDTQDACPKDPAAHEAAACPGAAAPVGSAPGSSPGTGTTPGSVEVGGPTGPARQTGPPVPGEKAADRSRRSHDDRAAGRPAPRVVKAPAGAHGSRPDPRAAPRRAPRDDTAHGRRPGARPTPRQRRSGADQHAAPKPTRPAPRRKRNPPSTHPSRPQRPSPSPPRKPPSSGHDGRDQRPAPKPKRDPGPQPHAPRPERPSPGAA